MLESKGRFSPNLKVLQLNLEHFYLFGGDG